MNNDQPYFNDNAFKFKFEFFFQLCYLMNTKSAHFFHVKTGMNYECSYAFLDMLMSLGKE